MSDILPWLMIPLAAVVGALWAQGRAHRKAQCAVLDGATAPEVVAKLAPVWRPGSK